MCGIGAFLDPAGHGIPPEDMLAPLRHRGPDGDGVYSDGPAMVVHTRLAIIDLAGGAQPMRSEDGTVAAAINGEIYNHLELRAELEACGHVFRSHSDSEVVIHGYEEWGPEVVLRLNGMFAFVIWDGARERLMAARDPFGIKPLYWWSDGRKFAAASEVTAVLSAGRCSPEPDRVALDHLVAWRFVPSPRTMFKGVNKLGAATFILVDRRGRPTVTSYRQPPLSPIAGASVDELADRLRDELVAAVQRQMMSDVPLGAFLSGGLDSAALAAAMAAADGAPPHTFTVGFPGHGGAVDEREAAAETARLLGTLHKSADMVLGDFMTELSASVTRVEEPCGTASAPAALRLSRFARQSVKVVLSGQGADEPLAGYQRHQAAGALGFVESLPHFLDRPAEALVDRLPRNERLKRAAGLLGTPHGEARLLRIFEITSPALRSELLPGGPREEAVAERTRLAHAVLGDVRDRDVLDQALYLDTHLFLPDQLLIWGDKTSMASGLEQRVPFLDVELMGFLERIPARVRMRRLRRKWLYRRAMRGLLPEAVRKRPKRPFATPYDAWLRGRLGEEVRARIAAPDPMAELVNPTAVERLVAEHRSGRADHKRILFSLLELTEWHRHFVEGTSAGLEAA